MAQPVIAGRVPTNTARLSPQLCALAFQVRVECSQGPGSYKPPGLGTTIMWLYRSGRWRRFSDVFCLGAFLPLDDFKFNVIALLQALVALRLDGAVVDEHIGAVIPTDEAETLCVVEPFHFAFNS